MITLYHTAFVLSIPFMLLFSRTDFWVNLGDLEKYSSCDILKGNFEVIFGGFMKKIGKVQKLDDYQTAALRYDTYPDYKNGLMKYSRDGIMVATESGLLEKVLGLPGEAGEAADKFKKILRDKNGVISRVDREEIVKELGDVLWYVAMIAEYLEVPLSEVANGNIAKLESRLQRNKIHGAGDNR